MRRSITEGERELARIVLDGTSWTSRITHNVIHGASKPVQDAYKALIGVGDKQAVKRAANVISVVRATADCTTLRGARKPVRTQPIATPKWHFCPHCGQRLYT